jgi:hypothetical protein
MSALRATLSVALAALSVAAGCKSKAPPETIYDWGDYEKSLYRMYVQRDEYDPAGEAQRLSDQVEQTLQQGKRVPPGVQAHIGMLCAATGDTAGAATHFQAEKAAFPESAAFVDGLLRRMTK